VFETYFFGDLHKFGEDLVTIFIRENASDVLKILGRCEEYLEIIAVPEAFTITTKNCCELQYETNTLYAHIHTYTLLLNVCVPAWVPTGVHVCVGACGCVCGWVGVLCLYVCMCLVWYVIAQIFERK